MSPRNSAKGFDPTSHAANVTELGLRRSLRTDTDAGSSPLPTSDVRTPVLNAVTLDTVAPERVDWLWPGRLPYGKLWLLDGDPGLGKSFVTLELAACISAGRALPGAPAAPPADVIVVNLEDGLGDTIRPRAEAAGADLARLHVITSVTDIKGEDRPPRLPDDVPLIRALAERTAARLIVIDPLTAYLDGKLDTHKDADMRRALLPLGALAEKLGVAVLVVRHLTKRRGGAAILAGGGSIGIIGAARGGLMLFEDPDDPLQRVLAVAKNNLAMKPPAITFTIQDEGAGACIQWGGASTHTADSLIAAAMDGGERTQVDEAADLLRAWLEGGPLDRKAVLKRARETGFSESTIDRAKKKLGVVTKQEGFGLEKRSLWSLPPVATSRMSGNPLTHAGSDGNGGARGPNSHRDNMLPIPSARVTELGEPERVPNVTDMQPVGRDGDVLIYADGSRVLSAEGKARERERRRASRNGSTPPAA